MRVCRLNTTRSARCSLRRGIEIDKIKAKAAAFEVAIPSWGVGTGGTRFARFPGLGEPRNILDKLDDCTVIQQLTGATPRVSLHIPWDRHDDPAELKDYAASRGLGFDAMNSNTFQDLPGQALSYKFGSLSHTDAGRPPSGDRAQSRMHHASARRSARRRSRSGSATARISPARAISRAPSSAIWNRSRRSTRSCRSDWRLFTEHKLYEPAFYSTVVQDWGTNYLIASTLGERAFCLVDLGHHAPNTNIEMIVARLIQFKKLGGFHFNDSKYGDDDLDSGAINPYQLFLVFNELVDAELAERAGLRPCPHDRPIAQRHRSDREPDGLGDGDRARLRAGASRRPRRCSATYQEANDALMASEALKTAFRTDVEPILAMARYDKGAAIEPIATYRASGYRQTTATSGRKCRARAAGSCERENPSAQEKPATGWGT